MKLKEELQKLKSMPPKKRLGYLADYYKWPFFGLLLALFLLFGLISSILQNNRETVLSCSWINESGTLVDVEEIADGFSSYLGLNSKTQRLLFDSGTYIDLTGGDSYSIASQSRLSVLWRDGDIDLLIGDKDICQVFCKNGWFLDLKEALSEELFQSLEPYFVFMTGEDGSSMAYGIDITASSINPMEDHSTPHAHVLCIPNTGHRQEAVWKFLAYIFGL